MKKKVLYVILAVLGFLVVSYGYVPQVLSGKIVNQSDISGWQGMSREMMQWNSQHPDDQTAWTNSMFGGMPTTTIHPSTEGDWTQPLYDLLLVGRRPATYLFISLIGAWLLMLAFGIHPLLAIGGALAVTFCSYNMQIIQVGHNTKMQAIAFLPWVLAALVFTYRKTLDSGKTLRKVLPLTALGAALFALFLSFQIKANHPQISYYLAIMILVYVIVELVAVVRRKPCADGLKRFAIASGLLLVLGVAGIGTNAIKLLPTLEYTPYSMRGGDTNAEGEKTSKGLDLDYATAWSYGWEELPNMMIPNYNGGSSSGAVNYDKSATVDLLRRAGQGNLREVSKNLPLYWGPQPFTAGPMYMGAVTVFLFLLGMLCFKGRERIWLGVCTLLAVLLALGSHFMWFTKLFYDFVPLYNKFRTVSMALVVLQFSLPLLGFLALDRILRDAGAVAQFRKKGWIAAAVTGGFCLLCALVPSIAGDFTGASDASMQDILVDALRTDRRQLLTSDALRSLLLIGGSYLLLLWGCTPAKSAPESTAAGTETAFARRRTAMILVCVLLALDLFTVGKRYLNAGDFVTPRDFSSQFDLRPVDEMILADTDPSYRVLDLTVNVFNDSHPSYHHKNIGGYSPAKLRSYQTFIENTLTGEINTLYKVIGSSEAETIEALEAELPFLPGLAHMNCRYIIVDENMPPLRYPHAMGNAWFADDEAGSIEMTSYAPNELRYRYSAPAGGEVVFSEVFYPVGWTLTLGGSEIPLSQTLGILRSAELPAGDGELVMRFDPPSYARGEAVSRCCSVLLLLVVLGSAAGAALSQRKREA